MLTFRAHWLVWALILLVVFMAIRAPATLGAVVGQIGHLLLTVATGLTHFLGAFAKRP
jgi:hypothetical protein